MPAIAEERERPRWAATSGWLTPAEEIFRRNSTGLWGMTLRLSGARPIGLDDPLQVGNAWLADKTCKTLILL